MFGREAAVKHTLLASESAKYLRTDNSMINIELMSKLYLVIATTLTRLEKPEMETTGRKSQKTQTS